MRREYLDGIVDLLFPVNVRGPSGEPTSATGRELGKESGYTPRIDARSESTRGPADASGSLVHATEPA
jgi:hypothetical protein